MKNGMEITTATMYAMIQLQTIQINEEIIFADCRLNGHEQYYQIFININIF